MSSEPFKNDGALNHYKINTIIPLCRNSVLEFGCNTGELAGYLNGIGIYAEGIDINKDFINSARTKFPKCIFHLEKKLDEFKDSEFETVVAWDVLEHIADDVKVLHELIRIAKYNVVLSIPKEDQISLPYSCITYRPYVDPTHIHYYTKKKILEMVEGLNLYTVDIREDYRVRPLMAYEKIGIPKLLCNLIDRIFWFFSKNKSPFYANFVVQITKDSTD